MEWGEGDISFPDIFLLVDCFKWALIGDIGQWRVDSVLWQFQMGEGGIIGRGDNCQFICTGNIGQHRVDSVLWQFQMGGGGIIGRGDNCQFICTGISWYIPISWPFQMGSHWWHWTVQSWLSALAVLNGGGGIIVCLSALVFPYIFLLVDHFEECKAVYHVQLLVQSDIWGG